MDWIQKRHSSAKISLGRQGIQKKGIGGFLFEKAVERERDLGAKRFYISSCKCKNTMNFYFHLGCKLTGKIDEELYTLEPKDIHMDKVM